MSFNYLLDSLKNNNEVFNILSFSCSECIEKHPNSVFYRENNVTLYYDFRNTNYNNSKKIPFYGLVDTCKGCPTLSLSFSDVRKFITNLDDIINDEIFNGSTVSFTKIKNNGENFKIDHCTNYFSLEVNKDIKEISFDYLSNIRVVHLNRIYSETAVRRMEAWLPELYPEVGNNYIIINPNEELVGVIIPPEDMSFDKSYILTSKNMLMREPKIDIPKPPCPLPLNFECLI